MRKFAISALVFATSLMITNLAHAAKLGVGSKAPAIKVAKWLKGAPVTTFAKGKVYVVEFWATWCSPCRTTIPHLTDLAKKYKGKATFVGVSVSEAEPGAKLASYAPKVATFVKQMGGKMNYVVALDGPQATMSKTWMDAAGQQGIPTAFVVNQEGKVVWIGHPMGELDAVVGSVIAGKFDMKSAKIAADQKVAEEAKARKAQEKQAAVQAKMQKLLAKTASLAQENKNEEALTELDRVIKENPEFNDNTNVVMFRFGLVLKTDEAAGCAYAKELAAKEPYSKDPALLNQLAWSIVDDKAGLKSPDYDVAVMIAEKAVELSESKDPMILDTLAYACFKKGDTDKALEAEEKAVKLLEDNIEVPKEVIEDIKERYEMMKKKKG